VIHTVGPVWHGGNHREAELLASCYVSSLRLATEHRLKTIAFPAISCGVYGYPLEDAVKIAVRECADFLAAEAALEKIIFACFDRQMLELYRAELDRL
jgi:O-acetyl-ADP-ribose deacetylase (regulator of RNase III)